MKTVILPTNSILTAGDEFKRKRNKVWRRIPSSMVGRAITKQHATIGFVFRRHEEPNW